MQRRWWAVILSLSRPAKYHNTCLNVNSPKPCCARNSFTSLRTLRALARRSLTSLLPASVASTCPSVQAPPCLCSSEATPPSVVRCRPSLLSSSTCAWRRDFRCIAAASSHALLAAVPPNKSSAHTSHSGMASVGRVGSLRDGRCRKGEGGDGAGAEVGVMPASCRRCAIFRRDCKGRITFRGRGRSTDSMLLTLLASKVFSLPIWPFPLASTCSAPGLRKKTRRALPLPSVPPPRAVAALAACAGP